MARLAHPIVLGILGHIGQRGSRQQRRFFCTDYLFDHAAYTAGTPSQLVQYAYDFGNRWVRKVLDADGDGVADASTIFVHDDGQIVLDFAHTGAGDASAADLAHRYLWGPAVDQLLADEQMSPLPPGEGQGEGYDLSTPGETLWALTDHLNSVRDLAQYDEATDTTTIARHLVYDAFGNVTSDTAPAVPSLFLYTARPFDEHTGLQNNLHRWYDAQVGRWLSEDPIGFAARDGNLYRYVGNGPLGAVDPEGLVARTKDRSDASESAKELERILPHVLPQLKAVAKNAKTVERYGVIMKAVDPATHPQYKLLESISKDAKEMEAPHKFWGSDTMYGAWFPKGDHMSRVDIDTPSPDLDPDYRIEFSWHTHPRRGDPWPSAADREFSEKHNIVDVMLACLEHQRHGKTEYAWAVWIVDNDGKVYEYESP